MHIFDKQRETGTFLRAYLDKEERRRTNNTSIMDTLAVYFIALLCKTLIGCCSLVNASCCKGTHGCRELIIDGHAVHYLSTLAYCLKVYVGRNYTSRNLIHVLNVVKSTVTTILPPSSGENVLSMALSVTT